jgi:chaperone modulatory protein CbpM
MNIDAAEAHFLDADGTVTALELVRLTGLHEDELHALVDSGALEAADAQTGGWIFSAWSITVARNARSLRDAFELADAHSLAVVTRFSQRVAALEQELNALRSRTGEV